MKAGAYFVVTGLALHAACVQPATVVPTTSASSAPAVAPVVDTARPGSISSAPSEAPLRELSIVPPSEVACALRETAWSGELQLRPDGPVFGSVDEARTTLLVPQAKGAGHVTIDAAIELRGVVTRPRIFLDKPIALGGFVVPRSTTQLEATGPHEASSLTVSLPIADMFHEPASVRQTLDCDAFAISPREYDARAFAGPAKASDPAPLRDQAALKIVHDGATVATIKTSGAGNITVVGSRRNARRIVIDTPRYVAFGWVSAEDFGNFGAMGLGFLGTMGKGVGMHEIDHASTCTRELDLIAQVGRERAVVGRLKVGARFFGESPAPADVAKDFAAIEIPGSWFHRAEGAHLLLRKTDLETCRN